MGLELKTRLAIAFITVTVIPLLLMYMIATRLNHHQVRGLTEVTGVDEQVSLFSGNSLQIFNEIAQKNFEAVYQDIRSNARHYDNMEYLDILNEALNKRYTYLIVRKNGHIIYVGGDTSDLSIDIDKQLPAYGQIDNYLNGGLYISAPEQHLIKQLDFLYPDTSTGTVFLVSSIDNVLEEVEYMVISLLWIGVFLIVLTGASLMLWIYHSVVKPISKLEEATQYIKDGNLDFVVNVDNYDEIGTLCQNFEEMRCHLKASVEDKIRYDQESKELISNISHDLKTPITVIQGYAEGILDGVAVSPEKLERYIRTIYNKANDMDKLIDELTFYSKVDTNKIPYNFVKVNVCHYFRDCVEELGVEMESRNIDLGFFYYVNEDVQVIADLEQLKRVINNIISNSVKYLDKKRGIINIRIKDIGDAIQVEIEDNGKGISSEDLPNIFERFYRTDSSRNSSQGGSGIGLSIVKKVIEDHGGRIWASSREGIGTEIHFILHKYQEVTLDE